jgi:hypothetical protein
MPLRATTTTFPTKCHIQKHRARPSSLQHTTPSCPPAWRMVAPALAPLPRPGGLHYRLAVYTASPPRRLQCHRGERPIREAIAALCRANVVSATVGRLATCFCRSGHRICEKNDQNYHHVVDPLSEPAGTPPMPWNRQCPMTRGGGIGD